MSHEIRTPLNGVLGNGAAALESLCSCDARHCHARCDDVRNGRLREMPAGRNIPILMAMAELEADRFELNLEDIALCGAVRASIAGFRRSDSGVGRVVEFKTHGDAVAVRADPRAVRQMVLKLLANAAKYSPAGTTIQVTVTSAADGWPRLGIADAGIGMTPEQAQSAVRPFGRIDGGLARHYDGLGLGLSIVSKLIERHGGRLTIAGAPQRGTQISLDFPNADNDCRGGSPVRKPPGNPALAPLDTFLTEPRVAKT